MLWFATEMLALLGASLLLGLVVGWLVWGRAMRARRRTHDQQLSVLQTQLASLADEGRRTQTRFAAVAGELDTSKLALQSSSVELLRTREAFTVSQGNLAGAETELGSLRRSLGSAQQLVAQGDHHRGVLQADLTQSQSVVSKLETDLTSVRSTLSETQQSLLNTQRSLANSERTTQAIRVAADTDKAVAAARLSEQASQHSSQKSSDQARSALLQNQILNLGRSLDAASERANNVEATAMTLRKATKADRSEYEETTAALRVDVLELAKAWELRSQSDRLALERAAVGQLRAERELAQVRSNAATTHRLLGSQISQLDEKVSYFAVKTGESESSRRSAEAAHLAQLGAAQRQVDQRLAKTQAEHHIAIAHWKSDIDRRNAQIEIDQTLLRAAEQRVVVLEARERSAEKEAELSRQQLSNEVALITQKLAASEARAGDLQQSNDSLHRLTDELSKANAAMQDASVAFHDSISALHAEQATAASLAVELGAARAQLREAQHHVSATEVQLAELHKGIAVSQQEFAEVDAQRQLLLTEVRTVSAQAESAERALRVLSENAAAVESELLQSKTQLDGGRDEQLRLQAELERVSFERHLLEEALTQAQSQHGQAREAEKLMESELRQSRVEVARLASSVDAWAQLHETLDEQHGDLQQAHRVSEETRLALAETNTDLETQYVYVESKYASLESDFSELQANYGALEVGRSEAVARYGALEADHLALQANLNVLQGQLGNLHQQLGVAHEEYQLLQTSAAASLADHQAGRQLEQQAALAQHESLAERTEQLNVATTRLTEVAREYDRLRSERSAVETENDRILNENAALAVEFDVLRQSYLGMQQGYEALQASHATLDEHRLMLVGTVDELRLAMATMHTDHAAVSDHYNAEIGSLHDSHNGLRAQVEAISGEREMLAAELKNRVELSVLAQQQSDEKYGELRSEYGEIEAVLGREREHHRSLVAEHEARIVAVEAQLVEASADKVRARLVHDELVQRSAQETADRLALQAATLSAQTGLLDEQQLITEEQRRIIEEREHQLFEQTRLLATAEQQELDLRSHLAETTARNEVAREGLQLTIAEQVQRLALMSNELEARTWEVSSTRRELETRQDLLEAEALATSERHLGTLLDFQQQLDSERAQRVSAHEVAAGWRRELEQLRVRFEQQRMKRIAFALDSGPVTAVNQAADLVLNSVVPANLALSGSVEPVAPRRARPNVAVPKPAAANETEAAPQRSRVRAGLIAGSTSTPLSTGTPVPPRKLSTGADNLQRIEGIGPKIDAALRSAGITTFVRLESATLDQLRDALASSGLTFAPSLVTWSRQAAFLVSGDEPGFAAYTERLVAGREETTP
jgi:predicted flap endonuclease-1-like 5' DNA nuclease